MTDELKVAKILNGYAVAVVHVNDLPEYAESPDASDDGRLPKFVVHPHVEEVSKDDAVLFGYLERIHGGKTSLATDYPGVDAFANLTDHERMRDATVQLAENLAEQMARRNANRGIVFGAWYTLSDGTVAHGILKVDLNSDQRFHFATEGGSSWSLEKVSDILPPPKQDVAKYVIAPQPGGDASAGMLDATQGGRDKAANYLLNALGLRVPRTVRTRAQVATAAAEAGVSTPQIHERLQGIEDDMSTEQVFEQHFPEVSDETVARVIDADSPRPLPMVLADDDYKRVYKSVGRLTVEVSNSDVEVEQISDRELRVRLPEGAEPITTDFR